MILIEVIHMGKLFDGTQEEMKKFLEKKGYKLFKDVGFDQIYVKKDLSKIKKNWNKVIWFDFVLCFFPEFGTQLILI